MDTLVFGGASSTGVACLSLLRKMISDGHIDMAKIKSFAGTSSGAMLVALLSAGFSPDEILTIQESTIQNGCFEECVLTKAEMRCKGMVRKALVKYLLT